MNFYSLKGTNTSMKLLKAEVTTVPLSECNETYLEYNKQAGNTLYKYGISESQYCASDPTGRSGSCHGDSGVYHYNRAQI